MKNNVKNALNALGLLIFMALAWATTPPPSFRETIKMSVKINADSTAFVLKNLENRDFKNGHIDVYRHGERTETDSITALIFTNINQISIGAQQEMIIPFNEFKGYSLRGDIDTFSKNIKIQRFIYSVYLGKRKGKRIKGYFDCIFSPKPTL
jgi:hypothetical protein